MEHYDLCVLGAGSGGVRAARMAAQAGANVAIIEEGRFGGTCVNVGCVPKKLYVIASGFEYMFRLARDFGWSEVQPDFAFSTLKNATAKEIARLNEIYRNVLRDTQVTSYTGHGRLHGDGVVDTGEQRIYADRILIATGSSPSVPQQLAGVEHAMVSDALFELERLPQSIAIYGGGYIAVEFACIFNALGVETHLVYRGDVLLKHFDHETVAIAYESFQRSGVHMHLGTIIESIERTQSARLLALSTGITIPVEQVLLATGRSANTSNLGIEQLGIKTDGKGSIIVGEDYQTNIPGIFALGDVTGDTQLTPMAIAEAMDFVRQQFDPKSKHRLPTYIPTAIFSQPSIASVGMSEQQARHAVDTLLVYTSEYTPLQHSLSQGTKERIFIKILVNADTELVVGMHMVGEHAGEIIQGFAAAMEAGLTKNTLDRTLGIHPTTAEEYVSTYQLTRRV